MTMNFMKYLKLLLLSGMFFVNNVFGFGTTFIGTVTKIDPDLKTFELREEGTQNRVIAAVSPGDTKVNYLNKRIKGELVDEGMKMRLKNIWPADPIVEQKELTINSQFLSPSATGTTSPKKDDAQLPIFALYDQNGQLVTTEDLKGKYVVMNFIFTGCQSPKMCPAATKRMGELQKEIANVGLEKDVRLITISFDPEHDTPGILQHYARSYDINQNMHQFLTGDKKVIDKVMKQFQIFTVKQGETLNHTMNTVIVDRTGHISYGRSGNTWTVEEFIGKLKDFKAKERSS